VCFFYFWLEIRGIQYHCLFSLQDLDLVSNVTKLKEDWKWNDGRREQILPLLAPIVDFTEWVGTYIHIVG